MKQTEIRERLTRAFVRAQEAADTKLDTEDRGAFNFDTVVVSLPKVPRAVVEAAGAAAGMHVDKRGSRAGQYWVFIRCNSMCLRRTAMAEAACASFKNDVDTKDIPGFSASMYYRLD
jgi:hypothetical protein